MQAIQASKPHFPFLRTVLNAIKGVFKCIGLIQKVEFQPFKFEKDKAMTKPTKADIALAQRMSFAAQRSPEYWRQASRQTYETGRKLFEMGDMRVESYQHAREIADGVAKNAELSAAARWLRRNR